MRNGSQNVRRPFVRVVGVLAAAAALGACSSLKVNTD